MTEGDTSRFRALSPSVGFKVAILTACVFASDPGRAAAPGGGLTPTAEVAAATFVDLDFSRFPRLPPNQVPAAGAIFVSPQGNDSDAGTLQAPFRTIAHAVRAASSGSTVVVRGGSYAETWESGDHRALVLTQDDLTLTAYPGETVWMQPASGVTYGIVVNARNLVLRGINLAGFGTVGILFESGAKRNRSIVIADLEITGSEEAIAMWEAAGSVDQLLLANVRSDAIIHCGVGPCSSWRLENVTIDAEGEGWGADAFAIESGDNFLVVNTRVLGAGSDGIDTKATRVVVLNSRVEGVQNNAIKLWHGGDVINTLILRGWQTPIVVEEGRFRLLNSTIGFPPELEGHRDYSMTLGYDRRLPMPIQIVNSIIVSPSGGAWINPESTSVSIDNSLFYTADGSETLIHGNFEASYSDGAAEINRSYGSGNLTADPLLDSDLRPSTSSPAIDAGIELPADFPLRDLEGRPRVLGVAPDLGAYEVNGAAALQKVGPPPAGKLYHGVYPGGATGEEDDITPADLNDYEEASGQPVAWVYFSHNWFAGREFPSHTVGWIHGVGAAPYIRLMLRSSADQSKVHRERRYLLRRILAGDWDAALRRWFRAARESGVPLIVEYGTECNGEWFPWNARWNGGASTSGFGDPTRYDGPERFVAAFRRLVALSRDEGAHNITWVFHVDWEDVPDVAWNRLEDYYPGNDVVDWVALSAYGPQTPLHRDFVHFRREVDSVYWRLQSVAPGKPVIVAEFGATGGNPLITAKAWTRRALRDLLRPRWPEIIAFSWWNERWENDDDPAHDTTMRLQDLRGLRRMFRRKLRAAKDKLQLTPVLVGQQVSE